MYRTFNNGIGMVVIVAADQAEETVNTLIGLGESAMQIGHIEASDASERVIIR